MSLVSIENFTFGWTDSPLYYNVNLVLKKGEIIQLTGDNGSGKSTLLQLIVGMVPHFSHGKIVSGDILLDGKSVLHHSAKHFFPDIAYIPGSHSELFLLSDNLQQELSIIRAMLQLTSIVETTKHQQFSSCFPEFASLETLPFSEMSLYQRALSLTYIFYLQNAKLFLIDDIINHALQSAQWDSFMKILKNTECGVIFVRHQAVKSGITIWEIKNQKIICYRS